MYGSEADRIARERRRQNEESIRRQQIEAANRAAIRRVSEYREIVKLIPNVLRLLKASGYPDMVDLEVDERVLLLGPFSPIRRRIRAAWKIGQYDVPFYESTRTGTLYLTSKGQICNDAGGVISLRYLQAPSYNGISQMVRETILYGLHALRDTLEAKLNK